jgi:uncharacterized LabA/DUF88 family protein
MEMIAPSTPRVRDHRKGGAMDRTAVFVDAGYLFAQGSLSVMGEKLHRSELHLETDKVVEFMAALADVLTTLPLLRIYWYDGAAPTGPTSQQVALAYKKNIKLRLGTINQLGQQKGVDSLIVSDLISLARNRAMADAVLVMGDEDVRVGVQQAQEFGVRVHLVGIEPARENQSGHLMQESDSTHELRRDDLASFLRRIDLPKTTPVLGTGAPSNPRPDVTSLAEKFAAGLLADELDTVVKGDLEGTLFIEVENRLFSFVSRRLDGHVSGEDRKTLRAAFSAACRARQTVA